MAGKGRYQDWIEGKGLENVCKWYKLGLMDMQVAHNIGIRPQTLSEWKRRFPSFAEAIKKAQQIPNLELENAMLELALGHSFTEETKSILDPNTRKVIRVEKTRKQIPPNATMQIFLAKNRMPDRYKDRLPVVPEQETEEGQQVQIYLPDNGRNEESDENAKGAQAAKGPAGSISADAS